MGRRYRGVRGKDAQTLTASAPNAEIDSTKATEAESLRDNFSRNATQSSVSEDSIIKEVHSSLIPLLSQEHGI